MYSNKIYLSWYQSWHMIRYSVLYIESGRRKRNPAARHEAWQEFGDATLATSKTHMQLKLRKPDLLNVNCTSTVRAAYFLFLPPPCCPFARVATMAATSETPLEPFLRGTTSKNTRGLLRIIILCTIAAAAVSARLFSVIRKSVSARPRSQLLTPLQVLRV